MFEAYILVFIRVQFASIRGLSAYLFKLLSISSAARATSPAGPGCPGLGRLMGLEGSGLFLIAEIEIKNEREASEAGKIA